MAIKQELVKFEPSDDLVFRGPYNVPSECIVKMNNVTDRPVAFKIKTTMPVHYSVRPNLGFIQPHQEVRANITYTGLEKNVKQNDKQKFLIQMASVNADQVTLSPEAFWNDVKKGAITNPVFDHKFKCSFPDREGGGTGENLDTGEMSGVATPYHSFKPRDDRAPAPPSPITMAPTPAAAVPPSTTTNQPPVLERKTSDATLGSMVTTVCPQRRCTFLNQKLFIFVAFLVALLAFFWVRFGYGDNFRRAP